MEKVNFQNRMDWGMKRNKLAFNKSVTLEYTKVGSSTTIKEIMTCTFGGLEDEGLKDMTVYNKDSIVVNLMCSDLITKFNTVKLKKTLNSLYIWFNGIKYSVVTERLSSDEVQLSLFCNTVG